MKSRVKLLQLLRAVTILSQRKILSFSQKRASFQVSVMNLIDARSKIKSNQITSHQIGFNKCTTCMLYAPTTQSLTYSRTLFRTKQPLLSTKTAAAMASNE